MKRLLTGTIYVLVVFGFFVLRAVFDEPLCFDLLILLFCVLGTFEMCRALGSRLGNPEKWLVMILSAALIICYCVTDRICSLRGSADYAPYFTMMLFVAGAMILLGPIVFCHEKTTLESVGYAFLAYCYPSVFLLVLAGVNHMPSYAEMGVLCVFVFCPFADCFAYVFGKLLGKKFPMKMSPSVSPNKTVIGGLGGLFGGAVGAVALFYVYLALARAGALPEVAFLERDINLIFFVGLGVLTAAFAELGDLAESAIKRKLGIKDMGKLLPGHGGVLDRIDSSLYASLIVGFVLFLRFMIAG